MGAPLGLLYFMGYTLLISIFGTKGHIKIPKNLQKYFKIKNFDKNHLQICNLVI